MFTKTFAYLCNENVVLYLEGGFKVTGVIVKLDYIQSKGLHGISSEGREVIILKTMDCDDFRIFSDKVVAFEVHSKCAIE